MLTRVCVLALALAVVASCGTKSATVISGSSADSGSHRVPSDSTATAQPSTATTPVGSPANATGLAALLEVQGDVKRVVGTMPTKCAIRYASNGEALPDPTCTPGVLATRVTQANIKATICTPGYTSSVRPAPSVTDPLKTAAERAYGLSVDFRIEYDHLVPLELGGANDVRNLWPEPPTSPTQKTTANAKDDVENVLHDRVCNGSITLADAQRNIATDWTTAIQ
jgi:hypothetical protein